MQKELNPVLSTLEGRIHGIAEIIDEMKGENIVFLDLRGICDFTDGFIVATMRSATQMQAVTGRLVEKLKSEGLAPISKPDLASMRWTLIDYGDVVVHLFDAEARHFYDLERLWGDAQSISLPSMAMA